ncbi:hypothetical protein SMKI_16G3300 [Saccharomyces mikatae IFO 1815]|uniref:THIF-type NAD/FAD binding fold domain-containing protein n=1 Tax=Saccharomyces mikatae IFO 1815 TaxID=226126 RepID=A0AA35IWH2_SACMI|nr:uncharacterized protein SMKI_16G3300 [Saccharomyces mikatae IFO 1815]CAI4037031.1 hypothetical protein SMKI_16G3300 [Saccharomyces mikatae IFO 1815]
MNGEKLSEDEIALYDRQIRLWGLAAQANMRSAKVLLINLGAVGSEITKSIVLSGIGHLTIMDGHKVTEEDLGSQFFIGSEDIGQWKIDATKERIQDLNPRVELNFDKQTLREKDEGFFQQFDLIVATEMKADEAIKINTLTRRLNIPLYIAGSNGLFAYIFIDLIEFISEDEKLQSMRPTFVGPISSNRSIIEVNTRKDEEDAKKTFERIKIKNSYKSLEEVLSTATLKEKMTRRQLKRVTSVLPLTLCLLQHEFNQKGEEISFEQMKRDAFVWCEQLGVPKTVINDEYTQQFIKQKGIEFAPVAAIIGGAVAQDVINILGKRLSPLNNFIVLDGITLDMPLFEF